MANSTRQRSKSLIEKAGLSTKDFQGTWHRARDFNAKDLQKEINYIKKHGHPSIKKAPSDVPKAKREKYKETFEPKRRTRIEQPKQLDLFDLPPEPPPKQLPKAEYPDGSIIVLWKDITKRGRKSRYPNAYKELKGMKKIMRSQDMEAIAGYIKEMLQQDEGKIGDIEIKLYKTKEQLQEIKKEYRGWQVIYNGKGKSKKDLLIGLAAVVTGVYNLALTKAAAEHFISLIKKIHPTNGEWLDEVYRNSL